MGDAEWFALHEEFSEIVNNTLVDVWQKTDLVIEDYEEFLEEQNANESVVTDMPQGMVVQYIPNGLIIMFGPIQQEGGYGFE
jgi:hypothetical protein|tara:strand:- start:889 stop:1134 length:246 start_codon:yes stop_codon:yes gene_type:complete